MTDPGRTLLAIDFDGTLSPIVDDPASAFIHPDALLALGRLGPVLGAIAVVTGRPVEQARRLGRFDGVPGLDRLVICGQYGAERWDASTGEMTLPDRPMGVAALADLLPGWLVDHDAQAARIEDKGLAIALHTRGVDPGLLDALAGPLGELAAELGLHVEPGRQVIELRAPGTDKGATLRHLVEQTGARTVFFVGDDLGDLPAFRAGVDLRAEGIDVTLVCSASAEQDALIPLADVVLDGPNAVAAWLTDFADRVAGS